MNKADSMNQRLQRKKIGKISYLTGGHGKPILLLHGIPGSAYTWQDTAHQLTQDYSVLIPDLLGFGSSESPEGCFARELNLELIKQLHQLLFDDLKPDITMLLDLSPQVGLARAWEQLNSGQRAGHESRFEAEAVVFHEKVRAGYLELARLEPDRIRIIDAAQTPDRVFADISKILSALMDRS